MPRRPAHDMVGRLKEERREEYLLYKEDPDLYLVCIRRETSPNPNRTPHVTRPFNIYKEGQGSPNRGQATSKKKQS